MQKETTDLSTYIHQAALNPHMDLEGLHEICDACKHFEFSGFCTGPLRLPAARKRLGKQTQTKLIGVIGFPFGDIPNQIKITESEWCAQQGAEELDLVPNFYELAQGNIEGFAEEISQVCSLGLPVRAILNMTSLNTQQLSLAIEACIDCGVIGIQTSNGFGVPIDASHIEELNLLIKGRCEIKAVGGIKKLSKALEIIDKGVSIIGTTMGPELMRNFKKHSQ